MMSTKNALRHDGIARVKLTEEDEQEIVDSLTIDGYDGDPDEAHEVEEGMQSVPLVVAELQAAENTVPAVTTSSENSGPVEELQEQTAPGLNELTVVELREQAKIEGVNLTGITLKAEIIEAFVEHTHRMAVGPGVTIGGTP